MEEVSGTCPSAIESSESIPSSPSSSTRSGGRWSTPVTAAPAGGGRPALSKRLRTPAYRSSSTVRSLAHGLPRRSSHRERQSSMRERERGAGGSGGGRCERSVTATGSRGAVVWRSRSYLRDWGVSTPPHTTSSLPTGTRLCSGPSQHIEGHCSDPRSVSYLIQDPPSRHHIDSSRRVRVLYHVFRGVLSGQR